MNRLIAAGIAVWLLSVGAAVAQPGTRPPPPPTAECPAGQYVDQLRGPRAPHCSAPAGLGLGNVTGPGSAVSGNLAIFGDVTGKVIADAGIAISNLVTDSSISGVTAGSYGDDTHCVHDVTVGANGLVTEINQSTTCPGSGGGGAGVSSITGDNNFTCSASTGDITCGFYSLLNPQTGTSYTIDDSDMGKTITHCNLSATAVGLPEAGTTGFENGKGFALWNKCAGVVTMTATTSLMNGSASPLVFPQNMGCALVSDGTNWQVDGFCPVAGIVPVSKGGTGLSAGTSGGINYYSASGTLASSGALTANLPVIGGGAGVSPSSGTVSGNTTAFVTTTGTQTSGRCVKIDANGNHVADATACVSTASANTWTGMQSNCQTTLSAASNIYTPDGTCNDFKVTLAATNTIANPSVTPVTSTYGSFYVCQDGTGSRTVTWGSQYVAEGGVATLTLSTAASVCDTVAYHVIDSTHILVAMAAKSATH